MVENRALGALSIHAIRPVLRGCVDGVRTEVDVRMESPRPTTTARHSSLHDQQAPSAPAATVEGLPEYPELDLVLSVAVDSVLRSFGLDDDADRLVVAGVRQAARVAVLDVYAPMASKARVLARTAEDARQAKLASVRETASSLAAESAAVAASLRTRGEESAREIAAGAATAANRVAAAVLPGDEVPAAEAAARMSRTVQDAAAQSAGDRTRAEQIVSRSVSLAVSTVAEAADAAATAAELEVLNAALTVEAIAFDACFQVAIEAATSAATSATGRVDLSAPAS